VGYMGRSYGGVTMMKEAGTFFAIVMLLLVGCVVYIEVQGGSFSSASQQSSSTCGYQDYRCMAREDAIASGINPDLFERQINMESGFNPNALSWAGAKGIAQIIQSTADSWGVNPWDPTASLLAASQHMASYYRNYGYDYGKALACYQAGCGTLARAMANCSDYYYCLPASTRRYIDVIEG
jgi:soluble lytic murein transglycosylase-like protein